MRIRRIEPIAVRLPMRRPVKMAREVVTAAENVLVRLETADGIVGWGEAASAPTMTGETVATMMRAVNDIAPLIKAPQDLRALPGNPAARSAIDMAMHDALGKALGKPICEILGGQRRGSVPLLWTLSGGDEIEEARDKRRAGYTFFKIKVGVSDPAADAARTNAICDALYGAELVCADANQGWEVDDALAYVRASEQAGLAFLEQPVAGKDIGGMARIAAATRIPIAFDEGVHGLDDIRSHHAARAAAGGSLKTIKLGGLSAVMEAAELCRSLGMKVNLACKIAESGIAAAALLHLAAAVPSIEWGVSPTSHNLEDDLLVSPLLIANGLAQVPRGPGLGIEVREKDLARYRI